MKLKLKPIELTVEADMHTKSTAQKMLMQKYYKNDKH